MHVLSWRVCSPLWARGLQRTVDDGHVRDVSRCMMQALHSRRHRGWYHLLTKRDVCAAAGGMPG